MTPKIENLPLELPEPENARKVEEVKPADTEPSIVKPPSLFAEIPILIRAQVKMVPRMDKPAVQAALINKIENYFESLNAAGSVVMVSGIIAAINAVDGVEKLETMNFFRQDEGARSPHPRDLKMGRLEIPVMGKPSILLR